MHRITMSLKSEIPEDVEFSMQQLVRISYEAGDELLYQYHPALCDILFKMLREGIDRISKEGREDTVASAAYTHQLERTNGVALIIRNMAFSPNNAKQFAMVLKPKDLLLDGLRLPKYANLTELKHYLLETIEVMANSLPFLPNDSLLDVIAEQLESNDRGMLLGAMRAICRLVIGRDDYNRLGDVPFRSIQRITSILMLEDEELVSACLDFLYQYTNNEDNTARLLQHPDGTELTKQLVRLLLFQGIGGEQLVYIKNINKPRPPIHQIPHLPHEIVQDLLTFSEPERATKWLVTPLPIECTC
jgi:chromatin structure-remodeling complex subunit RSC9